MAKTQKKTPQSSKPTSSLLVCCFGFSREIYTENIPEVPDDSLNEKRKSRWFSWRRILMKKSSTKTVPLNASNEKPKPKRRVKSHSWKLSKSKSKPILLDSQNPATDLSPPPQTEAAVLAAPNQTPPQTKHGVEQNRGDNRRSRQHVAPSKEDTRQKKGSSPIKETPAMSTSVSLEKRRGSSSSLHKTTLAQSKRLTQAKRNSSHPMVGMSVIMVTLIIMILWGRLCAILSTAAWLYYIPRFRTTVENDRKNLTANPIDMDVDSKVYKKKVILEGLLERNHNHKDF
ncbi:hypothetical protein L6164_020980 [Bauhinia variegata]|uniref:Uncharacterized protein n=1 Tax=Bauhinia variegata TaxID=167791 RepID=A0ACB9MYS8_BAUVA|nr:hypothetical protein L6164_020980 [Bauhinia variegata]